MAPSPIAQICCASFACRSPIVSAPQLTLACFWSRSGQLDSIPLPEDPVAGEEEEELTFGNSVYGIKFDSRHPPVTEQGQPSLFGHRYTFFLQDAVEEVPEYVVYWEGFVE